MSILLEIMELNEEKRVYYSVKSYPNIGREKFEEKWEKKLSKSGW